MKKALLLFLSLFTGFFISQAQIKVFHEDFELPGLDDSVSYFSSPTAGYIWNINTRLHYGATSLRSDSCQVKTGNTVYMISNSFNTVGNTYVTLTFSQICKVDFLDIATIEVSNNGGTTWTQLTQSQYLGTGQYGANGNRFAANSYGNLWVPGTPAQLPTNSWWKEESFDISIFAGNTPDVKIRFKLADGGTPGPNNNKGWFLDNILVTMAPSELIPPVITLATTNPNGVVWSVGPFNIKAKITDQSGIDTAYVVYTVNNGPEMSVGMVLLGNDTMKGIIPAVNDSDQVCYRVEAYDNSLAHNWARNPVSTCIQFTSYAGITFPFNDNFDLFNVWTPSYGGTVQTSTWQLGTPAYGTTNSAHSPPKAWDINLTTPYDFNGYCILTSPVFDFSNAVNARLSFWVNYYTQNNYDGVRMEYTTNGTTWQLLGMLFDPNGENWYNQTLYSTNQPGWAGNSNGWIKVKLKLGGILDNVTGIVRFRYVFNSNGWDNFDGFSIDDFSITLPSPQEVSVEKITAPVASGCGLGNVPVTVKIFNPGLTPITSGLTAGYKKASWAPAVIENVPGTIMPGDTLTYTFTTLVNLSAVGMDSTFNLKAWATLVNDPNHGDDTLVKQILSKFVPLPPTVSSVLIPYGNFTTITATSPYPVTWYDVPLGGSSIGTGPNYTTPILYGTMIYYPQVAGPNGCISPRAQDTVYVGDPPPYDAAALLIISPNTGFNLGNNEVVRTRIRNYGTESISNFAIGYSFNNNAPVIETVTNTLAPGDTITYTFTTHANIVLHGMYDFKSWVTVSNDLNHINDTAYKSVENKMFVYCTSNANNTNDGDIGNVTINNLNNGNPLPPTSNTLAINLYTDYSGLTPIYLAKGQSYPVSVSQITSGTNWYPSCIKIFVDWNYNGTFEEATETAFSAGPTSITSTTLNGILTVPLTAHEGYTRFRVVLHETTVISDVHACGTYGYGETEDYTALVAPQIPHDAGILSIINPPQTYPQGYSIQPEVQLANFGTDPITSVEITYQMDNNLPVSQTWTGNLTTMQTANVSFPAVTLPTGTHSFCAWTTLPNDSNTFNDTLCRSILGVPVDTLPYYDNFDGSTINFFPSVSTGTNWIRGVPVVPNFPSPAYSPPNVWATNLNMTGGYTNNALCYLTTQIFDFTNAINAKISFWYKCSTDQYGDGVQLQYSLNGGTSWVTLGGMPAPLGINWYTYNIYSFGPAWTGSTSGWKKATYLLSDFNLIPTMRFRFVFRSDGGTTGQGFAIDDFQITIPYHQDAGVDSILSPQGQAAAGSLLAPQVRLVNYGMDTLHTVDVSYTVNGGNLQTNTWTGTLKPGASTLFNFTSTYAVPDGNYQLKVFTQLPNDGDHNNDTARRTNFGIPVFTIPYYDEFDLALTYWYAIGTQWQHGSPTSPVINYSLSPPFCWKTNLTGKYVRTGQVEYLYSPMFDFSQTGYDSLIFEHWVDIFTEEGGNIQYLSNTGWKTLGWMGDPSGINWYTNNDYGWSGNGGISGWHKSKYDLSVVNDFASPTQFRFSFLVIFNNTLYDGWAVDNFRLTSPKIPKDAGVTHILQPVGQTTYGTDMNVIARIRNYGMDTLYSIPVKYQVNGTTVNAATWTGTLLPDSSVVFSLPPYPSPTQNFGLCVFTDLALDTHFGNDTTCSLIGVISPAYDVYVSRITTPVSQTIHGDSAIVKIIVKNAGQNPVSDIPLAYVVSDSMIIVKEDFHPSSPIAPGDSATYTFIAKYSYEYLGYYYLCSYTDYPDDGYRLNDTICKKLEEFWTLVPENESDPLYLSQNIPNPSNAETQVMIRLPKPGEVRLAIVTMLGQVAWEKQETMSRGEHLVSLNTQGLPPGIYYYYMIFDHKRLLRKMVVTH